MAVFSVMMDVVHPAVGEAITLHYPRCRKWSDHIWFLVTDESAIQVSEKIFKATGSTSGVVVIKVSADYYGYSASPFWDWLKASFGEDVDG